MHVLILVCQKLVINHASLPVADPGILGESLNFGLKAIFLSCLTHSVLQKIASSAVAVTIEKKNELASLRLY